MEYAFEQTGERSEPYASIPPTGSATALQDAEAQAALVRPYPWRGRLVMAVPHRYGGRYPAGRAAARWPVGGAGAHRPADGEYRLAHLASSHDHGSRNRIGGTRALDAATVAATAHLQSAGDG